MNYFIDFEATQYSNRIISIGVVREDGKEFYSLVNPDRKITPFITNLTGITQADVNAAPSADEVFSALYDFFAEDGLMPRVFCYGNGDVEFTRSTFYKMVTNFKAASALSYLTLGMINYETIVKSHFGLTKNIGLARVANYYRGEEIIQNHNALDDAKLLKYVYEQIECHEDEFEAFPEYKTNKINNEMCKTKKSNKAKIIGYRVHKMKKGKIDITFNGIEDAINWIMINELPENQRIHTNPLNIGKNIKKASDTNQYYFKCKWVVEPIIAGAQNEY